MKIFQTLLGGIFLAVFLSIPLAVPAQRHDYLTEQEADVVREAQEIDQRVNVLTKIIDRRFLALGGGAFDDKKIQKDTEILGDVPKSTRSELLFDINHLLQKAIDDIDNVSEHSQPNDKIFPKAVKKLTESSQRYLPLLKAALDTAENEKDKGLILGSIEFCGEVIEASAKLPKDAPRDAKKSKNNSH